jgi:hypothetical protein
MRYILNGLCFLYSCVVLKLVGLLPLAHFFACCICADVIRFLLRPVISIVDMSERLLIDMNVTSSEASEDSSRVMSQTLDKLWTAVY